LQHSDILWRGALGGRLTPQAVTTLRPNHLDSFFLPLRMVRNLSLEKSVTLLHGQEYPWFRVCFKGNKGHVKGLSALGQMKARTHYSFIQHPGCRTQYPGRRTARNRLSDISPFILSHLPFVCTSATLR